MFIGANSEQLVLWEPTKRTPRPLSMGSRFRSATRRAERLGKEWTLTLDQYAELLDQCCHYCGGDLPVTGIGLDRANNAFGYTLENSRPCCTPCNRMKGEHITEDEMIELVSLLMDLRLQNKVSNCG